MDWYGWSLFGALIGGLIGIPVLNQRILLLRLNRAGLDDPTRMTDQEMATHMGRLFHALGYHVERPQEPDSPFDLILLDGLGQRRGVLLRHWRNPVDEQVVAIALAAAAELERGAPMIVTVRYFTWQARRLAEAKGAILWTLTDLTKAIGRLKQAATLAAPAKEPEAEQRSRAEALAVLAPAAGSDPEPVEGAVDWPGLERQQGSHWTENQRGMPVPHCPRCGRRMIIRRQHGKRYWGCPAYPRCIGTLRN